jgi:hypothetical protein
MVDSLGAAEACEAVEGSRFRIPLTVDGATLLMVEVLDGSLDRTDAVDGAGDLALAVLRTEGATEGVGDLGREGPTRDLTETVEGAGDLGRAVFRTEGAVDGVGDFGREGPAAALNGRAVGFLVACNAAILVGDFGLVVDLGIPDTVVFVVRTELTDAADDATGVGRVINGRIGPLISRPCLVEGVGLVLTLALAVPMFTFGPSLAAVGLRALAVPGKGAVAGPETDRADLALVIDAVEAELLSRKRLRPGGSAETGTSGRSVDGREVVDIWVEEEAVERTLAASDNDMTRDVVRGIPGPGAGPKRVRIRGESADGPSSSFTLTSISGISSLSFFNGRLTIADLFQCPIFQMVKTSSIPNLRPPSPDMCQDTFACVLDLLS